MKNTFRTALLALFAVCTLNIHAARPQMVELSKVMNAFYESILSNGYYSDADITAQRKEVRAFVGALQAIESPEKKAEFIQSNQLSGYVKDAQDSIAKYRDAARSMATDFLDAQFPARQYQIADKQACMDSIQSIIDAKLSEREEIIAPLRDAVEAGKSEDVAAAGKTNWLLYVGIGVGAIIVLLLIVKLTRRSSKPQRPQRPQRPAQKNPAPGQGDNNIVVRRKTMTILKKQTLEDVVANPAYLKIDCSQMCDDSAIRYLYLKNTCVRDIYNMYEADLKQANRPAEDGCMVLGRWVHDPEADEYYVSMEHVVMPGDDAVFKEYELNFGGKIKMKIAEMLRRLRRDTNLQYDLTCWVHSHPGLGVFFSNADSSVHDQLKHPTHPRFLIAFVIDILTPDQELGIFTFRHDQSINAKPDLKKMYSLVDLNKWAVETLGESVQA